MSRLYKFTDDELREELNNRDDPFYRIYDEGYNLEDDDTFFDDLEEAVEVALKKEEGKYYSIQRNDYKIVAIVFYGCVFKPDIPTVVLD